MVWGLGFEPYLLSLHQQYPFSAWHAPIGASHHLSPDGGTEPPRLLTTYQNLRDAI